VADVIAQLREWGGLVALPLWATTGFDDACGAFHERLNLDGTPDRAANKRVRVQARQIYVYAHAATLGWCPQGLQRALDACEWIVAKARSPDGRPGYVHLLDPGGTAVVAQRDAYDHAFLMLALGWLAKASGDAQIRALAEEAAAFVEEHLTLPDGSLRESIPDVLPRRQNPHMHAFEAMLALHETIAHPQAHSRARRYLSLLEGRFIDSQTRTLGEYFAADWSRAHGDMGDIAEPGHHAEWAWLLRKYERLTGTPQGGLASELLDAALHTADETTGFLIDEIDRQHRVRRSTRRSWVQTELAKAWMAEAEAGRAGAADEARAVLAALKQHYLDQPFPGGWMDQFDAAGKPLTEFVPASTLYHVFCAIAEADRALGVQPTPATVAATDVTAAGEALYR